MIYLSKPTSIQLEITDKCNFCCRHCYHLDYEQPKRNFDLADEGIIAIAEKIVENQIFSVIITGGEPLVRKKLVRFLVKMFKENNMDVSLNTNLQLLDSETLESLIVGGLDGMLVSCPSSSLEMYKFMTGGGEYGRFMSKLEMLVASGQHFAVNMVVNKINFGDIRSTAKRMKDAGVRIFGATPMGLNLENPDTANMLTQEEVVELINSLIWIKDNLGMQVDIFEALPKCIFPAGIAKMNLPFVNRRCQAGKTVASIANNGGVRPCSHNSKVYGNILCESLSSIWEKMSDWRGQETVPDSCVDCNILKRCFGGCRITAKAYTGLDKGKDPLMTLPIHTDYFSHMQNVETRIDLDTKITFAKIFRFRKEGDYDYLVSSTRNNGNMMIVNRQLLSFMQHLKRVCPLKLSDLARLSGVSFTNLDFQKVVRLLITRGFILSQ